jgi:hypothetical protein
MCGQEASCRTYLTVFLKVEDWLQNGTFGQFMSMNIGTKRWPKGMRWWVSVSFQSETDALKLTLIM